MPAIFEVIVIWVLPSPVKNEAKLLLSIGMIAANISTVKYVRSRPAISGLWPNQAKLWLPSGITHSSRR